MTDQSRDAPPRDGAGENASDGGPDSVAEWPRAMMRIAERSQRIVNDFLTRQAEGGTSALDPLNVGTAFYEMTARMLANPSQVIQAQMGLWQGYMDLWQNTTRRMLGEEVEPLVTPAKGDRRFRDEAWDENILFDYIKQSYLLSARWLQSTVSEVEGLDAKTAQKVDFYTRQYVDAIAPSNFVMTNPQVLRTTIETGGENLVRGLENLLDDLERGKGKLHIRQSDEDAFEVGRNLATTPGKVVFENDLFQLIQYAPATETVFERPVLVLPPWINKYYILDMRPENSFIRWCVGQGLTVFVVSWVNPDGRLAEKSFEDYMLEGALTALDAVITQTGTDTVNAVGYCLGGTLLATTLAYMRAKDDARIHSATFLTTMLDFAESGELGVFIDEEQLAAIEEEMREKGYLEGHAMAGTFNLLRANDLIWSFVVNNYLLGKDPFPFDLLYWNSDSTRMPAAMHGFYLRRMYQENALVEPGAVTLAGVPIDLTTVKTPAFFLSTREDHIAPWRSTYAGAQLLSGPTRFCLSASGHIAGVVNPPSASKYCHWTNPRHPKDPDAWLRSAERHEGSWWPEWQKWLKRHAGRRVPTRDPEAGPLKAIEDAPGRYVKVRSFSHKTEAEAETKAETEAETKAETKAK